MGSDHEIKLRDIIMIKYTNLLANPHLLEGGKRCKNGTTDPDRVLAFRRSNNLDLHGAWCQGGKFLLHTISDTGVHGGTTRHDDIGVQVLTDINIALHDGVVSGLMNTSGLKTDERRLEESFGGAESIKTSVIQS
jgi:hypothetical protein